MSELFKRFRILAILLVLTFVATGCSSPTSAPALKSSDAVDSVSESSLKKVPLKIFVPGDKPKQQEEVLKEIDRVTENELNINLQVNYIPWGDYINQVKLKSAGGEIFDIYLSFFNELPGNITRKQCLPLNSLLDKYGPDIKKQIPKELWDSLTIEGEIYGIPAVYARTEMARGFLVRKDLREKYKLPEITDAATYMLFLDTIAKNEKDIIPMLGETLNFILIDKDMVGHSLYTLGFDQFPYMYIDIDKKPFKVENYLQTDLFKKLWKEDIKAYQRGWIEKDILMDNDREGKFLAGKAASMGGDLYNIIDRQNALKKNVPTGEIELAIINKDGRWINMNPGNNFGMLSSTSKNPERAMMFMNWLRKSQENYDLYMLGIKGKTYNLVGDKAEVPPGTDPKDRYNPTPWFTMHMPYLRSWISDPPSYTEALKFWSSLKPENSELMGFSYSSDNVKAEKAAVEKICLEEGRPLQAGLLSSEEDYNKLLEDLDKAGLTKIIEDTQKQLDAYMAKRKK